MAPYGLTVREEMGQLLDRIDRTCACVEALVERALG